MIPADWEPHHRTDDGEHVGYLVPLEDDLVRPATLVGTWLGEPSDRYDAEQVLDAVGLSYLIEPWELVHDDGTALRVVLLEISPHRVIVGDASGAQVVGAPRTEDSRIELPNPTDRLRRV